MCVSFKEEDAINDGDGIYRPRDQQKYRIPMLLGGVGIPFALFGFGPVKRPWAYINWVVVSTPPPFKPETIIFNCERAIMTTRD